MFRPISGPLHRGPSRFQHLGRPPSRPQLLIVGREDVFGAALDPSRRNGPPITSQLAPSSRASLGGRFAFDHRRVVPSESGVQRYLVGEEFAGGTGQFRVESNQTSQAGAHARVQAFAWRPNFCSPQPLHLLHHRPNWSRHHGQDERVL